MSQRDRSEDGPLLTMILRQTLYRFQERVNFMIIQAVRAVTLAQEG